MRLEYYSKKTMEMQEEFSSFRRIFYFSVFPLSAMVRFTSALYASVRSTEESLRGLGDQ